ncbi:uncharacterized protein [Dermacentor albipictus]|uniref:uncharacterized protein isoform X3 n=1 Tax=Dermacentor albipictus TaxID=60249 RepID=UPI0038FD0FDF
MASSAASLKVIDVTPVPWDNVYRFSHAMLANIKNMRMPPSCTEPRMPLYLCCLLWLTTPDLSRIVTQKIGNVSQRHHSQPLAVDVEHPSCCSHHENETFLDEGNWMPFYLCCLLWLTTPAISAEWLHSFPTLHEDVEDGEPLTTSTTSWRFITSQ